VTAYKLGDKIRYTSEGPLGTLEAPNARGFTEHHVFEGTTGVVKTYSGQMPEGWVMTAPDAFPDEWCPVHPSMIELA
jgi:hypothetical protein